MTFVGRDARDPYLKKKFRKYEWIFPEDELPEDGEYVFAIHRIEGDLYDWKDCEFKDGIFIDKFAGYPDGPVDWDFEPELTADSIVNDVVLWTSSRFARIPKPKEEYTELLDKFGRWYEKKEKGEWLWEKEQGETAVVCSICGGGFYQDHDDPALRARLETYYRFCPFCGARMETFDCFDEEDEEA